MKKDNVERIVSRDECTGCSVCVDTCPEIAITSVTDNNGFIRPAVDDDRCTECGKCLNVCPVLHVEEKTEPEYSTRCFCGSSKNQEALVKSSSGGAFGELSKWILNNNGHVFGAAFNKDLQINHIQITSTSELDAIRGSKYLQSHINGTYLAVKELLKKGETVLFSGTPCQVAGFNKFIRLNHIPDEKLFTCELICHGVNSEKIFRNYINSLEKRFKSTVQQFFFRDKEIAWEKPLYKAIFENGKVYKKRHINDPFGKGFSLDLFLRPSCYTCKFCQLPRKADISMGDYWEVPEKNYNKMGVSILLLNSNKGQYLFDSIKTNLDCAEIAIEEIAAKKFRVNGGVLDKRLSDKFWKDYESHGYRFVETKYLKFTKPPMRWIKKLVNGEYYFLLRRFFVKNRK